MIFVKLNRIYDCPDVSRLLWPNAKYLILVDPQGPIEESRDKQTRTDDLLRGSTQAYGRMCLLAWRYVAKEMNERKS